MSLFDLTDTVYNCLKSTAFPEGTAVIKAFPYIDKPTRLENAVIAVTPGETELESAGIGACEQYGEVKVRADIFSPQQNGSEALLAVTRTAVTAGLELSPLKIYVSPVGAEDRLSCLCCSCIFTFDIQTENAAEV